MTLARGSLHNRGLEVFGEASLAVKANLFFPGQFWIMRYSAHYLMHIWNKKTEGPKTIISGTLLTWAMAEQALVR